jgi:hypothetical protein
MPNINWWRQEKFCETNFRRDAEKHTPEAYAPQTNTTAVSISEFGFNALKALIDAQQALITALQAQLNLAAKNPNIGEFDPGFADPPPTQDLENIRAYINQMNAGMNW